MPLEEYDRKRDFTHTPEPVPVALVGRSGRSEDGADGGDEAPRIFVLQKHAASRLHYDFRLELDGVLVSWAVPKGPSLDPLDKRLAMRVEDHPLEYASFEGTIPQGEYGGGTVIVWDRGTWRPLAEPKRNPDADPRLALEQGSLKFELAGVKLAGTWALVRMKPRPNERGESWLLIKERDAEARPSDEYDLTAERPESATTGRTIEEVAREGEPEAESEPRS